MATGPITEILKKSKSKKYPDSTPYTSISVDNIQSISKHLGLSGREIEIAALQQDVVPERYARNMKSFSLEQQAALLQSQVSVVGLGGLGGAVVEILARAGIGHLNLIDGDKFEDSNLNRQFLSICDRINTPKVQAAIERIHDINPSIGVTIHYEFLDQHNGCRLLEKSDVTVDCLDNINTRFILEKTCRQIGSPFVSAAVAGSAGHVTTIFPEDPGLQMIYGDPDKAPARGAEATLGTVPYTVTLLAALQTAEVIKIIQKKNELLRNKLLIVDLEAALFQVMDLN
ncbi:MAG: HesA/MoeB/ThiF family protein [Desulfobacterales bacterium]